MIITEAEVASVADLRPTDYNKMIEVILYRKWTSKHIMQNSQVCDCRAHEPEYGSQHKRNTKRTIDNKAHSVLQCVCNLPMKSLCMYVHCILCTATARNVYLKAFTFETNLLL